MGRRKIKGNMEIDLTVDALDLAPHVDHIVLFSGDGDFRPLVEALQKKGVRVSIVSTVRSQPPMIADELRRQADNFIELYDLRDVIGRPPRPEGVQPASSLGGRPGNPGNERKLSAASCALFCRADGNSGMGRLAIV